jgi:D-alanyl-D-alanine carboxypeptidase
MVLPITTLRSRTNGTFRKLALAGVIAAGLLGASTAAEAARSAAIVIDGKTGKVLYANDADGMCYPASLTKMMTLYLLFEAIDSGRLGLNSRITVSAKAAAQAPSKLGLKPGQTIAVRDAILALVTKSANDIAVAVAEAVGGSEKAFASRMTAKARALGMKRTTFRNASGLPDPGQVTTARDMSTLGRALQEHFPKYYAYFGTKSFVYGGRRIANHNRLLGRVAGVNGIKTGYTRASGFNLVTSVSRNKRQLIAVVLGGRTGKARDQRMAGLIEDYLPRASTGAKTVAVVPGAPSAATAAVVAVADATPPTPQPKPHVIDTNRPIVAASLVGADSDAAASSDDASATDDLEATDDAEGDVGDDADAPKPAASPKFAITVKPIKSVPATDALAPVVVAAAESEEMPAKPLVSDDSEGWKIQLAATPDKASANKILKNARAKAGKLLASTKSYTQPVVKDEVTLYRARISGFENRDAARAACEFLVEQNFSCLALSD